MTTAYAVPKAGSGRAATWAACGVTRMKLLSAGPVQGSFVRVMSRDARGRAKCLVATEARFYRADVRDLPPAAVDAIVAWCVARFDVPEPELRASMVDPAHGLPILANDDVEVILE